MLDGGGSNGTEVFSNNYGQSLFDAHIPELLRQLKRIADELKRYNDREEAKDSGE